MKKQPKYMEVYTEVKKKLPMEPIKSVKNYLRAMNLRMSIKQVSSL